MSKQYEVENRFSPLHSDDVEEELHDEEIDNPLTRAAKKQIREEEGEAPELDIDQKFEVEDEAEPEADEDEDAEPAAEAEEEEDDEGDYSARVKKRILREKKRADRLQTQLSENESRLARLEQRWEAEADEKKLTEKRQSAEEQLTKLRSEKKAALEEGDTDKQIEVDEKILDLKAELRVAESEAREARRRLDESKATGEVIDGIDLAKLPPKAREWIDAHPQFRTDAKFRRAVLAADNYLVARGLNHQQAEYWKKLESEVSEDFPRYFRKETKITRKPTSSTAGSKGAGPESAQRKGKIRITADDKRNMIRFGMDPNNRDHLREFAQAKLTSGE